MDAPASNRNNHSMPFECRVCHHDRYRQIAVIRPSGLYQTPFFACQQRGVMFTDPKAFRTPHETFGVTNLCALVPLPAAADPATHRPFRPYQRGVGDGPHGNKRNRNKHISCGRTRVKEAIGNGIQSIHNHQRMKHVARIGELPAGCQQFDHAAALLLGVRRSAERDCKTQREEQCRRRNVQPTSENESDD
jgi:hypothetical protein